jgi:hypothetical protein
MKKNLDIVEQQYHANSGGGIYKWSFYHCLIKKITRHRIYVCRNSYCIQQITAGQVTSKVTSDDLIHWFSRKKRWKLSMDNDNIQWFFSHKISIERWNVANKYCTVFQLKRWKLSVEISVAKFAHRPYSLGLTRTRTRKWTV